MKITLSEITIAELTQNYRDDAENGVTGFDGRLDIRPKFQREFVYSDDKRSAVIDTVVNGFPLNVMYWAVRGDGGYEVIDGQQRTISICQYVTSKFSIKPPHSDQPLYFHNLQDDQQRAILDYRLTVYQCDGTDSEKLGWFKTINIAGERLTDQELRNAVYSGPWVTDAKRYFSRVNGAAYGLGSDYLSGAVIRQEYLETAIDWISNGQITDYMGRHMNDPDALPLWTHFQAVIGWARQTFPKYRKEMKGLDWGGFYRDHGQKPLDPVALGQRVDDLMQDYEVVKKAGIYEYVLTGDESCLNLRSFSDKQKRELYDRQGGICPMCKTHFDITEMEADHIDPWHAGGKTDNDNGQMLCRKDNRRKSNK